MYLYNSSNRCASWSKGSIEENYKVQIAVTRALFSVTIHKAVRTTIAGTKDCLYNFLEKMVPLDLGGLEDSIHTISILCVVILKNKPQ